MTAVEAKQFGPARYRVVYANGYRGDERTLPGVLCILRRRWPTWPHGEPVRVEPVPGTEYRATYLGTPGAWHGHDGADDVLLAYVAAVRPLTRLELRSPVRA